MKYRFIWFDLGHTLVRASVEELYQQVLDTFDVYKDIEDIRKAVYLTDKEFMRRYPHVLGTPYSQFMPWYIGVLNYNLGIRLDLGDNYHVFKSIKNRMGLQWRLLPGVSEVLDQIKQRGINIGLISNWDHTCRAVLAENGIDRFLDVTVISSEAGVEKPDAGIFQTALNTAEITAEQSLYVGDNYYDDVIGAAKAGINCLLIAPYGRLGIEEINHRPVISSIKEVPDYLE